MLHTLTVAALGAWIGLTVVAMIIGAMKFNEDRQRPTGDDFLERNEDWGGL